MSLADAKRAYALYWPAQAQRNRGVLPLFALVTAMLALYVYLFPGSASVGGVSKFAQNWFPLALASMAQAILMLAGGISLTIGAMVSLGAVIAATTMTGPLGVSGGLALAASAGLGVGAICGIIVVRLRLPAIIVTLAASFIIGGAALLILPRPGGAIPAWFSDLLAGDTPVAAILLILTIVVWKIYLAAPIGLSLYAAGENPVAAYRAGVPVDAARIAAYAFSGLLTTCAGVFIAAQTGSGDPVIGEGFTLNSIAAAVLGGVGFLGGQGAMRGAVAGSLLLSLMISVMYFLGFPPVTHYIDKGSSSSGRWRFPRSWRAGGDGERRRIVPFSAPARRDDCRQPTVPHRVDRRRGLDRSQLRATGLRIVRASALPLRTRLGGRAGGDRPDFRRHRRRH